MGELMDSAGYLKKSADRLVDFCRIDAPKLIIAREALLARERVEVVLSNLSDEDISKAEESLDG